MEWYLVAEFRFCGRFSAQTQRPPSDPQWTWIDEAEAQRRWHSAGAELTVVPPADPMTGRVPYVVVITCGASPSYTVRRFLAPIFCDLELWWKNTGDGLALDVVHAMVFPEPAEEWDEAHVSTTARIGPDGSVYLTRAFRTDPGVRGSWVTEPASELAPLGISRLRRAEPAWGMWNELLDLSMFPNGVLSAAQIDTVFVAMRDDVGRSSAAAQPESTAAAQQPAAPAGEPSTSAMGDPEAAAASRAGAPAGSGGFRFCGRFDPVRQDAVAASSWIREDEARRVMYEVGGELTLVGPEESGVPRAVVVVACGPNPGFHVSRQVPPGVPDLTMRWHQVGDHMLLDRVSIMDYDEPVTAGDEPALTACTDIAADGSRRLTLSSKGSETIDTAEMPPIEIAEAVRPVPRWGAWAELLDAPPAIAR
ncbi:hypothetical protein BJY17_001694 [Agromyces hippuratus]|uniref:Uncharacterized protein n=1 Tax=Agromyces hippuratus TaxID=286438 RepID=A0A852WTC6_9MICO|nr:hypothetical protein [Agromyces hippuratus]NYG20947.1 hypothetical protein [Agromyces hippuratus]